MTTPNIGDLVMGLKFSDPIITYTKERLQTDLAAGVGTVLAGVGSDYRLEADATNGWVLLKHKDVAYGHTGGGAGYTGAVRTAVGITANGFMAGYNDKTTGDWVNSIAIDATTGAASFAGAINATSGNFTGTVNVGSVIAGAVTVNGTSLLTIKDNAALGATAVRPAAIANFIDKRAETTLSGTISPESGVANSGAFKVGTITWNSTGTLTGGSGIAITARGIIGAKAGVGATFSVDIDGNAFFKGDISGARGTFAGAIETSAYIYAAGDYTASSGLRGAIVAEAPTTGQPAINATCGQSGVSGSAAYAIQGEALKTNAGGGVLGKGLSGVGGLCTAAGGKGVAGDANVGTYGVFSTGRFGTNTTVMVANLNANYLNGKQSTDFLLTTGTAANSSKLGTYTASYFARYVSIAAGSPGITFTHSITVSINGVNVRIPIFYP